MSLCNRTFAICSVLLALFAASPVVHARQQRNAPARGDNRSATRLPSPDKIIGDYVRAIGGKRRIAAVRDAVYEWDVEGGEGSSIRGTATLRTKAPAAVSWKYRYDTYEADARMLTDSAACPRSSWFIVRHATSSDEVATPETKITSASAASSITQVKQKNNKVELTTLTGVEASAARLEAVIYARRIQNYKKQNILLQTAGVEIVDGEAAIIIEASSRDGGRLTLSFSRTSKLLLQIVDKSPGGGATRLSNYQEDDGILEPHIVSFIDEDGEGMRLTLRSVTRNTGIQDDSFDPPGESAIDVPALLREVARNQNILDERVSEYTFTRKQTEREINDRGEVKKEKIIVHEVYPVRGGGRVLKLISEDGVALTGEKLAREEKRVAEEIEKVERGNVRAAEKRDKAKVERAQGESGAGENGDDDLGVAAFLRACEFIAPRRERFRERDAIVFDFRPRAGFKPSNNGESLVAKLTGIVWIDPIDKQVMRLEARLTDGLKIGGGLVARVRPGSAFVIEQTRLADGVWLPRFSQINASAKVFLLAGFRLDAVREYGDYKRFATEAKDYELKQQ